MAANPASTASDILFWPLALAGTPGTGTADARFRLVATETYAPGMTALERRLASLPTLTDLEAELRLADPLFDSRVVKRKAARYQDLLAAVERGEVSRLAVERMHRGLTQAELAKRARMAQANVSRLERPGATMRIATVRRLALALGLADYRMLLP